MSKTHQELDENELMRLEKKRLGIPPDRLVFIGMANLANYYWCAWQYYLKSKREESGFFLAYFEDRLACSMELNLIKKFPKNVIDRLKIGDEIKISHIHKLLSKKEAVVPSNEIREEVKKLLNEEKDPRIKGKYYEILFSENYPKIRWNFRYKDIVLVGVPDGITNDFVYEFKSTEKTWYKKQTLITAACQADVYGVCFKKHKRRVQIYCKEENEIHTFVDTINKQRIIDLLEKWIDMMKGKLPLKPQPRKCIKCEFKLDCVLLKS